MRILSVFGAAFAAAAAPCYAPFNNLTVLETPCYTVEKRAGAALELRRYAGSEAFVAQSNASAQITTYQEALMMTSFYVIDYLTGDNTRNKSLLSSRTVPLTLHPPTPNNNFWLGRMALAPSQWPPHSTPPAPRGALSQEIAIAPFGRGAILLASQRQQFTSTPQPSDYDALCTSLTGSLALLGAKLDASSPFSPTHAYYYGEDTINPAYDAECWLGVTAA